MILPHLAISAVEVRGQLLGRAADRLGADGGEPRLHLGQLHRLQQRRIDLVDDGLRCAGGHVHREPRRQLVARQAGFRNGRHIGQCRRAFGSRHAERAQLAGLDVRHGRGDAVEHVVDLSADEVGHGRAASLVRHVQHVDLGHRGEQLARKVDRRSVAGGCVGHLAGLGLGLRDHVGHGLRLRLRDVGDQHVGYDRDAATTGAKFFTGS